MKNVFLLLFIVLLASFACADVKMLSPVESSLISGASIQAGSVSQGQIFELIFSDDSGYGQEWNKLTVTDSLPLNWEVVSTQVTDASLSVKIKVPENANLNFYVLKIVFSNTNEPTLSDFVNVSVVVKENLLDVSFIRDSSEQSSVVGESIIYKVVISNSSIAPYIVNVRSTLPFNWFEEKVFEVTQNSSSEFELEVKPLVYGKHVFSFQAISNKTIVSSFSSALNIQPTLKGKFSSVMTGFPFFNFSLLPFQMFTSFFSLILEK